MTENNETTRPNFVKIDGKIVNPARVIWVDDGPGHRILMLDSLSGIQKMHVRSSTDAVLKALNGTDAKKPPKRDTSRDYI